MARRKTYKQVPLSRFLAKPYTEEDMHRLARAVLDVAKLIKEKEASVVLVPERGGVPLAKMISLALYELHKKEREEQTKPQKKKGLRKILGRRGKAEIRLPVFIYFPNTASYKYNMADYLKKRFANLKRQSEQIEELIAQLKSEKKSKRDKRAIKSLNKLKLPKIKDIVIVDEMNTGTAFYLNYAILQTAVRDALRDLGFKQVRMHGIGFARKEGANLVEDREKIVNAIYEERRQVEDTLRKVNRDLQNQVSYFVSKYRLPYSPEEIIENPELLDKILQEKIKKWSRRLNKEKLEAKIANIKEDIDQVRAIMVTRAELVRIKENIEKHKPKIERFIWCMPLERIKKAGEHSFHKIGYPGTIKVYPVKEIMSMDKPEFLGEVFLSPPAYAKKTRMYLSTDRRPTADIMWHPSFYMTHKDLLKDFHYVLKKILKEEKK